MVLILKRKKEKTSKGYRLDISTHKLIDKMQLMLNANYPSGIYYDKLIAGDYAETKRLVLIK